MNKENIESQSKTSIDMSDVPTTPMKDWYAELGRRIMESPNVQEGKTEQTGIKYYPSDNYTAENYLERLNHLTYPDKRYIRKNTSTQLIVSVMEMYAKQEVEKWQSQHSYTEVEVIAIIDKVKQKCADSSVLVYEHNGFDDIVNWLEIQDGKVSIYKQSITDIDFKYLLK